MSITATEFKKNLGKYIAMAATVDVYITRNGKTIAKLTSPFQERMAAADSLIGIIPAGAEPETILDERLSAL